MQESVTYQIFYVFGTRKKLKPFHHDSQNRFHSNCRKTNALQKTNGYYHYIEVLLFHLEPQIMNIAAKHFTLVSQLKDLKKQPEHLCLLLRNGRIFPSAHGEEI